MPTPIVSFSVPSRRAAGAVIITASHNPPTDNGFKVRDHRGAAIAPEELKLIEARIPDSLKDVKRASLESGSVETFDPAPAYVEYVKGRVDLEPIKQAGLVVAYDAMWGVGAGWLARLLEGGTTTIHSIRGERNPVFPGMRQPEPIPPNVDALLKEVIARGGRRRHRQRRRRRPHRPGRRAGQLCHPASGWRAAGAVSCWKCAVSAAPSSRRYRLR